MASQVRVDQITDIAGTGAPELTYGATLPSGSTMTSSGDVNISGIATVGFITATHMTAGIVTATSFVGNGSQLTSIPTTSAGKAIALKFILDPLPFRS